MSSFMLKIIACISMFIDHLRYITPTQPIFMSYIGRIAFPIFAFQIAEGYTYTKNPKKYLLRLLIFAILSQIPYTLYFNKWELNVIFDLLLGLLCIYIFNKYQNNNALKFYLIFFIYLLTFIIKIDYGFYGISIILIFYIFRNNILKKSLLFIVMTLVFFIINYKFFWLNSIMTNLFICTLLGIIPCVLYNKKQGPKAKFLFYLFYPGHLLFLFVLSYL